jgi:hypothetical protein
MTFETDIYHSAQLMLRERGDDASDLYLKPVPISTGMLETTRALRFFQYRVCLGSRLCKNVVPLPLDLEPLGRGDFGGGFLGVCGFDGWREAQEQDLPF